MSEEKKPKVWVDGMIVKKKEGSPDFVVAELSFKVEDFKVFLDANPKNGWVNTTVKRAQSSGKLYGELNTFEPQSKTTGTAATQAAPQQDMPF